MLYAPFICLTGGAGAAFLGTPPSLPNPNPRMGVEGHKSLKATQNNPMAEAAMLGVYRTGSRHVGCVLYWEPPWWMCIVPEAAMLGVYHNESRHFGCVLFREPPYWVCIAPGAAMLGVYCTALGAAMLYAPFI